MYEYFFYIKDIQIFQDFSFYYNYIKIKTPSIPGPFLLTYALILSTSELAPNSSISSANLNVYQKKYHHLPSHLTQ